MKRFKVEVMLIFVVIFWGGNFTFSKWALSELSSQLFTLYRFSIAFPIMLFGTYLLEGSIRIHKKDWLRLVICGFVGVALYQTLFMESLKYTSSTNAALINAMAPIFTGIFAVISRQERFTWKVQIGSIVAFAGAAIIILSGNHSGISASYPHHIYGEIIGLAAALIFGVYPIITAPLLRSYSSLRINAWSSGITVFFLLLFNFKSLYSGIPLQLNAHAWIGILYAVIPVTVFGLVAWYHGVSKIGPTSVMIYMYAIPLSAAIISFFILGESIHMIQIIGGIIILFGISVVKMKAKENLRSGEK